MSTDSMPRGEWLMEDSDLKVLAQGLTLVVIAVIMVILPTLIGKMIPSLIVIANIPGFFAIAYGYALLLLFFAGAGGVLILAGFAGITRELTDKALGKDSFNEAKTIPPPEKYDENAKAYIDERGKLVCSSCKNVYPAKTKYKRCLYCRSSLEVGEIKEPGEYSWYYK